MINHGKTQKHKSASSLRASCWRKLDFVPEAADKVIKQEIALALFTCLTNSVDHLSDLSKLNFNDGKKYVCTGANVVALLKTFCIHILQKN